MATPSGACRCVSYSLLIQGELGTGISYRCAYKHRSLSKVARMFTGPYKAPASLGQYPLMCTIIVIGALTVPLAVGFSIASSVSPNTFILIENGERVANMARVDLLACLIMFGTFLGLTYWSEAIGAGPFAGTLKVEPFWIVFSVVVSPLFWIAYTLIPATLFQGNDWLYSSREAAESMDMGNWSVSLFIYAILLAPLLEEMVYRGIGFGCLVARGFPPIMAIAIPNIVFAVSHQQYSPVGVFIIFLGGFWFGFLRIKTGSILAPIIGHMSINATLIYLSLL
ncbi:MAG: CPBP family intramembrane glutamic endopeptidase [Pseudomonadota bacterium]